VATGTVKWFNATKGYGFVQPQSGGKDVFVHISAVERAGLSTLNEGAVIEYELVRLDTVLRSDAGRRWPGAAATETPRGERSHAVCAHVGKGYRGCIGFINKNPAD